MSDYEKVIDLYYGGWSNYNQNILSMNSIAKLLKMNVQTVQRIIFGFK